MSKPEIFAPVNDLGEWDALESWRWLVGEDAEVRLLTAMGDIFLVKRAATDKEPAVFLLDTCGVALTQIATSWMEFKERVANPDDEVSDWFKYDLLYDLHAQGKKLSPGECYSPELPPVIGGQYETSNFKPTHWRVHVGILGQLSFQVKDLPEGTRITGIDVEWQ